MSKIKYPYTVDYNDHFETPQIAYRDILPLLDAMHPTRRPNKKEGKKLKASSYMRADHIIYDPYYCDGRTKIILESIGFRVQHEKRDFYKDVENNEVPKHHTLVTNPPYSDDHKERCVQYAMDQARGDDTRGSAKPFFILMPNYVACRNYFRSATASQVQGKKSEPQILYVVPFAPYEYEHPEGTGKDLPPFGSIWFCGIPSEKVDEAREAFNKEHSGKPNSPRLATSLEELKALGAVPTLKRKNLKQRLKAKRRQEQAHDAGNTIMKTAHYSDHTGSSKKNGKNKPKEQERVNAVIKRKKTSKYRDEGGAGKRQKKRF